MPNVKKDESEDDYVKRAIPVLIEEGTAKNGSQAAAIAHSMYREHHARKRFKKTYKEDEE